MLKGWQYMTVKQPTGTGEWKCGCISVCARAAESTFCSFFRMAAMPTQTPQTPDTSPQARTVLLFNRAEITKTAWSSHDACRSRRSLCQLFVWTDELVKRAKTNQGRPPVWTYRDWPQQQPHRSSLNYVELEWFYSEYSFLDATFLILVQQWCKSATGSSRYISEEVTGSSDAKTPTLFWCPPVLHFCALLTPCSNPPWFRLCSAAVPVLGERPRAVEQS